MPRQQTPYYPTFAKQSLTTAPDWVWQRALELVSANRNVSIPRDGPDIARAMRYLRAEMHGFRGHWSSHRREDPGIYEAVKFRAELGKHEMTAELRLCCHVLSGRSLGWLAASYDIDRSVMSTYLKTFFDVQDRLHQRQYILHRVIGLSPGVAPSGYELALLNAYQAGAEAVEPWLDWIENNHEEHDLSTEEGRRREAISIDVAIHQFEPTETQSYRLRILEAKCPEIARKMFRTRLPGEQLMEIQASKIRGLVFADPKKPKSIPHGHSDPSNVLAACENESVATTGQRDGLPNQAARAQIVSHLDCCP